MPVSSRMVKVTLSMPAPSVLPTFRSKTSAWNTMRSWNTIGSVISCGAKPGKSRLRPELTSRSLPSALLPSLPSTGITATCGAAVAVAIGTIGISVGREPGSRRGRGGGRRHAGRQRGELDVTRHESRFGAHPALAAVRDDLCFDPLSGREAARERRRWGAAQCRVPVRRAVGRRRFRARTQVQSCADHPTACGQGRRRFRWGPASGVGFGGAGVGGAVCLARQLPSMSARPVFRWPGPTP